MSVSHKLDNDDGSSLCFTALSSATGLNYSATDWQFPGSHKTASQLYCHCWLSHSLPSHKPCNHCLFGQTVGPPTSLYIASAELPQCLWCPHPHPASLAMFMGLHWAPQFSALLWEQVRVPLTVRLLSLGALQCSIVQLCICCLSAPPRHVFLRQSL